MGSIAGGGGTLLKFGGIRSLFVQIVAVVVILTHYGGRKILLPEEAPKNSQRGTIALTAPVLCENAYS